MTFIYRMESSPLKIAVPVKKARMSNDFNKCIICQKGKKNTLMKASESGMKSFLNALRIRQAGDDNGVYARIGHLLTDDEREEWTFETETELFWHKTCFGSFASSSNLKYIIGKQQPEDLSDGASTSGTLTRSSMQQTDMKNVCMFCNRKSHNKDRKLIKVATMEFCKTLEKKVDELDDQSLRCKVGDFSKLIAYDACYHQRCHGKYLKQTPVKSVVASVHDKAFDDLLLLLQPKLDEGRAIDMNTVLEWYRECLRKYLNEEEVICYRKQKLKEKIEKRCSEQMTVYQVHGNKPDILVGSNLHLQDAINVAAMLKEALDSSDMKITEDPSVPSTSRILYYAALLLKSAVRNAKSIDVQPLDVENLGLGHWNEQVPDEMYNFFHWVIADKVDISEKPNRLPEDEQLHRQVLSMAQDLIYARSNGRLKTPKHIAVGVSLHQMTQSREVVTLINKLGHCVSYQEVQRIDTSWTDMQKSSDHPTVPLNMVPGRTTRAAGDNFNRSTEALEGQHHDVVNMVLYQTDCSGEPAQTTGGRFGEMLSTPVTLSSTSSRHDTGSILTCPNMSGKNAGPHHLVGKPNLDWFFQCSSDHKNMLLIDEALIMLRMLPIKIFDLQIEPRQAIHSSLYLSPRHCILSRHKK